MGFKVSMQQRWQWALDKLHTKLHRWENITLSFAGRILDFNHYIIPATLFFLACWRPPEIALKQLHQLCKNFLWSGQSRDKKIPKVKWSTCILFKGKGGLGILDIIYLTDRLARKWIIRSLSSLEQEWAKLIIRNIHRNQIEWKAKWTNLPLITTLFSPQSIKPHGSALIKSLWQAWNKLTRLLKPNTSNFRDAGLKNQDSIWWSWIDVPPIDNDQTHQALKLHKKGIKVWDDL